MWNAIELRSEMPGVGDFVALMPGEGDGPAIIEAVLPRTSAMIRQAAGEWRPQLIAANVDIVLIVTALDGDFNLERIGRYLAVIREGGAEPVIIINKADIATNVDEARAELAKVAPNVTVHVLSARRPGDVAVLEHYFEGGKTVAFVGSSGVGKSTLTNKLLGDPIQATQEVRTHDNRGRHTTTHRQLFLRPGGGAIMDTPGMRSLELWSADAATEAEAEVEVDFSDIEALAAQCKFRNCRHDSEPACAVRKALEEGTLSPDHFAQFLKQVE
jgi:ribosome biogenesis GTPase